jgi:hypothetical protein
MRTPVWLTIAALACMAHASRAAPIQVQPIVVCDNAGANCAADPTSTDPNSTYNQLFNQTIINKIYTQTAGTDYTGTSFPGVSFNLLPAVKYDNTNFLTTAVDRLATVQSGNTTYSGNPVDPAHLLLRETGHGQSSNPNALNVFLVNQLVATTNGVPDDRTVHGFGLTSANGAVIDAGASPDSVAHELGHNLGLTHVDGQPYDDPANLMRSSGRFTTTDLNLIGTTYDQLSGAQDNDQIAQVNAPLFTVNLASATLTPNDTARPGQPCVTGVTHDCSFDVLVQALAATTESLTGVKIRFLDARPFNDATPDVPIHVLDTSGPVDEDVRDVCEGPGLSVGTLSLPGGGIEFDLGYPKGCLTTGRPTDLFVHYDVFDSEYLPPFSAEFDFADGTTSVGLFDATTNTIASPLTVPVGAIDKSLIPALDDNIVEAGDQIAVPTPEPASITLLPLLVLAAVGATFLDRLPRRLPPHE